MLTIVTVDELITLKKPVIFDCRHQLSDPKYGLKTYKKSHIKHAIYADLDTALSGDIIPGITGRHPLPERGVFAQQVRQWGLVKNQQAIVYDDGNGAFAARLWWMLRWLGHEDVAVLSGGFNAWLESDQPVSSDMPNIQTSDFVATDSLTKTLQAKDLLNFPGHLTDARDLQRFQGISEPIDPVAGHIPGASCLPFSNNINADQTFKSVNELRHQFEDNNLSPSDAIACYCGSGVTAAHNILALVHAGYPEPFLYPGSWSEWITDPDRPVATNV